MRALRVLCLAAIMTTLGFSVEAIEPEAGVDEFGRPLIAPPSRARFQAAAGIDVRIDDSRHLSAAPGYRADLYWLIKSGVALKAGVSYNHATKQRNRPGTEATSVGLEAGVRLTMGPRLPLAPFVEAGYSRIHYHGTEDYRDRSDTKNGLFVEAGLALNLGHAMHLDVGVKQIVNRIVQAPFPYLPDDPGPPTDPFFDSRWGRVPPKLYNPATVEMTVRFDL